MTVQRFQIDSFEGDFDALPLRSHLLFGEVPSYPTSEDFQNAACTAFGSTDVAARWRMEAIRWRLVHRGVPMDLHAIAIAVANFLFARRDQ
jgi:hypothetical protein